MSPFGPRIWRHGFGDRYPRPVSRISISREMYSQVVTSGRSQKNSRSPVDIHMLCVMLKTVAAVSAFTVRRCKANNNRLQSGASARYSSNVTRCLRISTKRTVCTPSAYKQPYNEANVSICVILWPCSITGTEHMSISWTAGVLL